MPRPSAETRDASARDGDPWLATPDLASQAQLLASCALRAVQRIEPSEGEALLARAREAGEALGGAVRADVLMYTAISLVFSGRQREGIAAFETLLGDVPEDLLSSDNLPFIDLDSSTLNFRIRKLGLTELLDTVRSRKPPRQSAG